MEKETKWLIGGIILAGLGFFIPLYFGNIWLALFISLLVATIFLGRIVSLSKKEFQSKSAYRIVYGLVFLVVLFNAISFAHDYGMRDFQKDILLEIRKTIDSGISKAHIQGKLIYVLAQYHQNDRESVVDTFRDLMPEHIGEDGVYISEFDQNTAEEKELYGEGEEDKDDQLNHFYEIDNNEDEIRIFVISEVALGEDREYRNYDGQTGQFEMMFTLNEEGVQYEVLN